MGKNNWLATKNFTITVQLISYPVMVHSSTKHIDVTITLQNSPSDSDVAQNQWAEGSHTDFRMCQIVV